jgi:hypothetical protein
VVVRLVVVRRLVVFHFRVVVRFVFRFVVGMNRLLDGCA